LGRPKLADVRRRLLPRRPVGVVPTTRQSDGGAGDNTLTLTGVQSPVRFTGGTGSDTLTVAASSGTTGAAYTVAPDRVTVAAGTAATPFDFTGIEQLTVRAADGPDGTLAYGTLA